MTIKTALVFVLLVFTGAVTVSAHSLPKPKKPVICIERFNQSVSFLKE